MFRSDLHVHTSRDHGRHSAREMADQAARQGLQTLGLVGHAAMQFPCSYAMTAENEAAFVAETQQLKNEYDGRLTILRGIELDYYSLPPVHPYDYRLSSVHYVKHDGAILSVDSDPEELSCAVQQHWGGDWLQLCRLYYETVAGLMDAAQPDIIAHFDLVTKFNEDDRLFSTADSRYRHAALEALDTLLAAGPFFEINTGAISRRYRKSPYPAPPILERIAQKGGKVLLSGDTHSAASLCCAFDTCEKLVQELGLTVVGDDFLTK